MGIFPIGRFCDEERTLERVENESNIDEEIWMRGTAAQRPE